LNPGSAAELRRGVSAEETGGDRRQGAVPRTLNPLLPPSVSVPDGERWIHEIKFDGHRVQVHLANEAIKVYTRRGTRRQSLCSRIS
jgi:ATP-dependent DNA ligase